MARVTVEDCVEKVPNRFQLVLLAAHRARVIRQGSPITIDRDNDKDPVVALREIADETVDLETIRDSLVADLQEVRPNEEAEREADKRALAAARSGFPARSSIGSVSGSMTFSSPVIRPSESRNRSSSLAT